MVLLDASCAVYLLGQDNLTPAPSIFFTATARAGCHDRLLISSLNIFFLP